MMFASILLASALYLLIQGGLAWAIMRNSPSPNPSIQPPLSVIVAAKNEAANLPGLLEALFQQTYSQFEVIIVLDRCTDESESIVQQWVKQYSALSYVSITQVKQGWSPKKWGLTQGIKQARFEWLVFTDADCRMGPDWLKEVASNAQEHVTLLLGLSPYEARPSLLNKLIRFETWYAAFQYVGWAQAGMPYMGVGRNLAYRKSFFSQHGGLEAFKDQLSGDDDLLINAYADPQKTGLMLSQASRTWSAPKESWKAWFDQKTRHLSSSPSYKRRTKFLLGIFHLSHAWIYGGFLLSLLLGLTNPLIWSIVAVRLGISWLLFLWVNRRFKEPSMLHLFPVLDLLFFLYNLIVVPIGIIKVPSWTK